MSCDVSTTLSHLVEEVALAITINGINHAVMMATPDDLDDFAVGFLFGEGVITHNHDVHDIEITAGEEGWVMNVTVANRCLATLSQRQRRLAGATGCGICGVTALEHALPALPLLAGAEPLPQAMLAGLRAQVSAWQIKGQQSGALHAALCLDEQGAIVACREDIGRHNALDKLIGMQLRAGQHCPTLLVTSRLGSELVQKAVRFGARHLISLAAPSQLAVKMALAHHLNLVHIPRCDTPVHYARLAGPVLTGESYVHSH
jgi:FdhD protein